MNLYRWSSELLKNYGPGNIVVMAPTVSAARNRAKAACTKYIAEYVGEIFAGLSDTDEDKVEYQQRLTTKMNEDLAKEPQVVMEAVVLIQGSD